MTPEQRYILTVLAEEPERRIRSFAPPGRPWGRYLIDQWATGPAYAVKDADVAALVRDGYLVHSRDAGGSPEITDAGRAVAAAIRARP